jgi:two-component system, NarL family, nitrate/nitrite response regulator NarL
VPPEHCGRRAGEHQDGWVITVARLVLGDDHVVFLDALSTVLAQHGYVTGAVVRSPGEMIAAVRREQPDVCLIDRHIALDTDAQTISRLREASDRTSVVVLSANPASEAVDRAMDAGASGYVHQSRGIDALVSALERVLNGEVVVDVPDAPPRRAAEPNHALRLAAHLTGRERQCLLMLVEGLDTAAMVQRLGVSRTTVRTHLQAVLTKLGVHSRLEAASFAVRHRLPDLWSEERLAAPASTVRPIRLIQTPDVGASVGPQARTAPPPRLKVAAGQVAGSA